MSAQNQPIRDQCVSPLLDPLVHGGQGIGVGNFAEFDSLQHVLTHAPASRSVCVCSPAE